MNRRQKRRQHLALEWIVGVAKSAQAQIDAGDLDFDDVLYRGRDAALVLLDIFDGRANDS
jgi:hypothetical protein